MRVVNPVGVADLEAFLASPSGKKLMSRRRRGAHSCAGCRGTRRPPRRPLHRANSTGPAAGRPFWSTNASTFPASPMSGPPRCSTPPGCSRSTLRNPCSPMDSASRTRRPTTSSSAVPSRSSSTCFPSSAARLATPPGCPTRSSSGRSCLPLLANRAYGLGLDQILTTRRDGLEPEEVYRWSKPLQRISRPFSAWSPCPRGWAAGIKQDDHSIYQKKLLSDPEKARFILESVLQGLRRTLKRLKPAKGTQQRLVGLHDREQ